MFIQDSYPTLYLAMTLVRLKVITHQDFFTMKNTLLSMYISHEEHLKAHHNASKGITL